MEQSSRLAFLFNRYAAGICTEEERDEYLEMIKEETYAHELRELMYGAVLSAETDKDLSPEQSDRILHQIFSEEETPVITMQPRKKDRTIWWAAAAVLVLLGASIWLWVLRKPESGVAKTITGQKGKSDVQPGGNKAVLTLADHSTIILDSAPSGQLAQQGSSVVKKTKDGELKYEITSTKYEVTYNMLTTPRGGQYQLVLPDGSKVWLNAASSIRYPTAFVNNERSVNITGEAYFEVAKDPKKPFRVHFVSAGREGAVEVLGTHFNINAYDDEPAIKTTLLEGSVKVSKGAASTILKPGEQTSISHSFQPSQPIPVQTEEVVAWKNGTMSFTHMDIEAIMRQAARWYDVDIVYKDQIADTYTVSVPRSVPLSQLLRALEQSSGVHFIIEGKKITVLK